MKIKYEKLVSKIIKTHIGTAQFILDGCICVYVNVIKRLESISKLQKTAKKFTMEANDDRSDSLGKLRALFQLQKNSSCYWVKNHAVQYLDNQTSVWSAPNSIMYSEGDSLDTGSGPLKSGGQSNVKYRYSVSVQIIRAIPIL